MLLSQIKNNKKTVKTAFYASLPIIFGYIPTGFIFGFMLVSAGYHYMLSFFMSTLIYAGAGQYLAVGLLSEGSGLLNIALMTFLINSKHLFYGLSLIEQFKSMGMAKFYMIFALTDETYAILTNPKKNEDIDEKLYMLLVSIFNHASWVIGSLLGGILGNIIKFDSAGMDFAMTALFLVIIVEQLKSYKTKLPFIIGICSGLFVCLLISKNQILLFGTLISVILLIIFKNKIENDDKTSITKPM